MKGENLMSNDGDTLDALLEFLNCIPKDRLKIIRIDRYRLMLQTAAKMKEILAVNNSKGEIKINVSEMFNQGYITTELDDLVITDTRLFGNVISKADNFEVYPKTNGKIQFNITFNSVLKTINTD